MQALRVDTDTRRTDTPTPTVHHTGIGGESFDIKKKNKRGEEKRRNKKKHDQRRGRNKKEAKQTRLQQTNDKGPTPLCDSYLGYHSTATSILRTTLHRKTGGEGIGSGGLGIRFHEKDGTRPRGPARKMASRLN